MAVGIGGKQRNKKATALNFLNDAGSYLACEGFEIHCGRKDGGKAGAGDGGLGCWRVTAKRHPPGSRATRQNT